MRPFFQKKEQHVNTYNWKEVPLGISYLSIYDWLTLRCITFLPLKKIFNYFTNSVKCSFEEWMGNKIMRMSSKYSPLKKQQTIEPSPQGLMRKGETTSYMTNLVSYFA